MPSAPSDNSLPTATQRQTFNQFAVTFAPDRQPAYCQHHVRCVLGTAPTLGQLNTMFPDKKGKASSIWLIPQFEDLTTFCGAREKMATQQFLQLATIVAVKYAWLKVTDIMLFCWRFKQGLYGRFYGSIDPMTITAALDTYTRERAVIIEREEQRRRNARYEKAKQDAVPCPDDIAKRIAQQLGILQPTQD